MPGVSGGLEERDLLEVLEEVLLMPEEIRAWNCSFRKFGCKKRPFRKEHAAKWHEDNRCAFNPEAKTCATCKRQMDWFESADKFNDDYSDYCPVSLEEKQRYYCLNACGAENCIVHEDGEIECDNPKTILDDSECYLRNNITATSLAIGCEKHILADKYKQGGNI